jgi:hypothetical protein
MLYVVLSLPWAMTVTLHCVGKCCRLVQCNTLVLYNVNFDAALLLQVEQYKL